MFAMEIDPADDALLAGVAEPRAPATFTPAKPHAVPAFTPSASRREGLHKVVLEESPASAAKLTLEGLYHWRGRLERELVQLKEDVETTAVLADRWSGKMDCGLDEIKALLAQKERDFDAVVGAITAIQHDLDAATAVARKSIVVEPAPIFLVPRATGHPMSGKLLAAPGSPRLEQSKRVPGSGMTTRDLSRSVARKSAILVNSPDVSKKLVF
jgi:hypothetical protein